MLVNFSQKVSTNFALKPACVNFRSRSINNDSFEPQTNKITGFWITNPHDGDIYETNRIFDITKPQHFNWHKKLFFGLSQSDFNVDFDPKKTGILIDKQTKEPIEVFILKSHDDKDEDTDNFHFISKDLRREYGYVSLSKDYKSCSQKLKKDYEKEGITGDRIIVIWLENRNNTKIGGVGKLADRVAVQYCIENGIEPNIVSVANDGSQLAHYKRGKRYFEPEKGSVGYEFLMKYYGTSNPNEIFAEMLSESEQTGEKIDLRPFDSCDGLAMYLPKDLVNIYK